jgi:Cu2+-exporting ATPase
MLLDAAAIPCSRLALAAGLAQVSRHPLSKAIARAASRAGVAPEAVSGLREVPGCGMEGLWRGKSVRLGSRAWCGLADDAGAGTHLEIILSVDGTPQQVFTFEDELREDAVAAISALKDAGLKVALVSGDRPATVSRLAAQLGIDTWHARQSPQDKLNAVAALEAAGRKVLMVGDGINDAPALAAGFTSMAPASASDIGRTAAEIVFLRPSLMAVPETRALALRAQKTVRQNFYLAVGYNAFAVPLAIAGLVTPLIAAVAMSSSSIIVVANALLLGLGARLADRRATATPVNDNQPLAPMGGNLREAA